MTDPLHRRSRPASGGSGRRVPGGRDCLYYRRRPDQRGRFLPEHTAAVSLLDRLLHHSIVVVTEGESFRIQQVRTRTPARLIKR
ncbi:ATP-binding protein [Nonomuraea sp. NPDC003214]